MPTLSWAEIRNNALSFEKKWADETNEHAEAKSFWDDFFNVFGISRRRVASFESGVKIDGNTKFIDLVWKGTLLIEHKSKGKDLDTAKKQAMNYFNGLTEEELPRYVLVCDFERFKLYDLDDEDGKHIYFTLDRLHENVEAFSFMAGYEKQVIKEQDPVNIQAAEKMGLLHDELRAIGYDGKDLEKLLVRIVFCLFADDTNIFNKNLFRDFITNETREDGSDLAYQLQALFEMLDTPEENRFTKESLIDEFPYVNGALFSDRLRTARFNSEMRNIILDCAELNWGKISPAIFGSMFQSAMNPAERRALGAHYTSEENILKVIKPLFLDDLWVEFNRILNLKRNRKVELEKFNDKLATLTFLDPACGSGNFLIISYRELRRLELEVIKELSGIEMVLDIQQFELIKVNVNQFYGIEIEPFASYIAQVAMWIIDHQMNVEASIFLGATYARLPLKEKAMIANDNSLTLSWHSLLDSRDCNYILGNPPFVGARQMAKNPIQKKDLLNIFENVDSASDLDYVCAWFLKASNYIQNTDIKVAFVSTNSICQGEQVSILWPEMYKRGIHINFAYKSFKWANEARGKAGVHCIIVGFSLVDEQNKYIFDGDLKQNCRHINAYLFDGADYFIPSRKKPVSPDVPEITIGNQLLDWTYYSFTKQEMDDFLDKEPESKPYFHRFVGSDELINDVENYVMWLGDCPPNELRKMPLTRNLVEKVREKRQNSGRPATKRLADTPTRYLTERIPQDDYLAIPNTSSENRPYIPMGYVSKEWFPSQKIFILFNSDPYYFGILTSRIHMAWMRTVSGRLKSDYSYSKEITYNNFPWPEVTEKQKDRIREKAKTILDIRKKYTESTYADLYHQSSMPVALIKAHEKLDKEVEKAYRGKKFENDNERVVYLFDKHKVLTNPTK